MKNQFILLLIFSSLTACSVLRPSSRATDNLSAGASQTGSDAQPRFIQDISTESAGRESTEPVSGTTGESLYRETSSHTIPKTGNGEYDPLQFKYAILTNSPVEELNNPRLLLFMDQWYGVPYHYGGKTRDGIDCSAFTCQLFSDVYHINQLPRMSADQFKATRRIPRKDLREGDLRFFSYPWKRA